MLHVLRPCLLQGIQGIWIGRSSRNKLQVLLRRQREVQAARRESLARARAALSSLSLPPSHPYVSPTDKIRALHRPIRRGEVNRSLTRDGRVGLYWTIRTLAITRTIDGIRA
jgi:hypothetical protein